MLKILTLCAILALALGQQGPSVELDGQGTVIGSLSTEGNYFEFHGIPYADATSGINRFKAPLPPPSFQTPLTANRKDIKCVRALGVGYEGTEDCLVVDIYTPTIDNNKKLPVMVWVKGKEFDRINNPELSFRNFIEKEVVVVSLNYRESVLGFLCLGTETAPGNAGLKDIIAGLKWIQKNIARFGGDPGSVTIVGHGSGGAAVDLVTMSPMGNGLVHKVIAQSGNAFSPWAVSRDNLKHAIDVAEGLGHTITNIEQLSEVFTRTSVGALMAVINELDLTDNSLAFAPCVERKELEGVEPFLIKTPAEVVHNNEFLDIPTIIGFVDYEGTIRSKEAIGNDWLNRMDESFSEFIQPDLKIEDDQVSVADEIKRYYFGSTTPNLYEPYLRYHGDTMILISSLREVRNRVFATESQQTYLYQFSYKGTLGAAFIGPINVDSAPHGVEVAYLFNGGSEANDLDRLITNILVDRWTNFAKNGIPSTEHSNVVWQHYARLNPHFLRIGTVDEIDGERQGPVEVALRNPHPQTASFWERIYTSHFLDAQSNWEIIDRNEDTPTTTLSPGGIDVCDGDGDDCGTDNGSGNDNGSGDGNDDCEGDDCDDGNSASTAVGYTFLIISLFSILNHFHSSQILS
ncbi:venom carboxylesterase-6-like [Spodoptera litura]|uniref:Venom carboxylesterase-6-like n=1 Tax=Spodoptera litura TaxID=69820 RepID=A0A9J7E516_SPOLT|nr:venom carboxylesterase-6-like [Spodoptera litura]